MAVFSYYKPHLFHPSTMFCAGGNNIDPCRVDTAMTENVGKLGNVFFNAVKHTGEQMTKIMRKYFFGIDLCFNAEVFHFPPDIRAAYRLARTCHEHGTCRNFLFRYIPKQFPLQITDDENTSRLALERDCCLAFATAYRKKQKVQSPEMI